MDIENGKVTASCEEMAVMALGWLDKALEGTQAIKTRRAIREAKKIIQAIYDWCENEATDAECPKCGTLLTERVVEADGDA